LLLACMLGLSACNETTSRLYAYTPPQTPGGRLCTNQCSAAKDYCNQLCDLDRRQCVINAQTQAIHDYDQYTRDQFLNRQHIDFRASDFERLGACDGPKKECVNDCENHYKSCYELCGGQVQTTSSCQFLCF
jgi:hypothetical protein